MKKAILFILTFSSLACQADVVLPKIITSNMVLQRDAEITIWGWADAGEKVNVQLGDSSAATKAGQDGSWKVKLPKQGLGKPLTLTVKGDNTVKLDQILMGDVWLCSGQSNMEWGIGLSENSKRAIAGAKHPTLRIFDVGKVKGKTPMKDIAKGSGWKVCTPESVVETGTRNGFSAVGYYFGKHLQDGLKNVPIGLIDSSWGGTKIEPWTTPAGRDSVAELKGDKGKYSGLYNGMVHGLSSLEIKGAIWYQGESNRKDGALYHHRKQALINGWRQIWGAQMPFYFVQLAPFAYPKDSSQLLPIIWEAQSQSNVEIPNTGMAVTIDIGNAKNIHPAKKDQVGQRLALMALKDTYKKDVVAFSPTLVSNSVKTGSNVTLKFKDVGGGLASRDGKPVSAFEVAGSDGVFVAAEAKITGKDTLVVSCAKVKAPVKVRYAWCNTPETNLMNKEGLPVGSFRFDVSK